MKRLLAEDHLILAKTIEIAQGIEAADRNVVHLTGSSCYPHVSDITAGTLSQGSPGAVISQVANLHN